MLFDIVSSDTDSQELLCNFVTTNVTYEVDFRYKKFKLYAGADLRWVRGARAPRFTCCAQMQKLADRSDVISEVVKCSKMQIFRGSARHPSS